ncbi:MAG: DivIVA domain-containing protein, partial [Rhodothermales bacterium]|nr:DivIVA domain-containing protein [Rhodothermales bacterium]
QDFKRTMRGVDPEEVQAFLQMVADQWQEVTDENDRLERRIAELEAKLTHYMQVEEAMQEALKTARHSSKQTLEAAKTKSKAIVEEAVSAATRIQKQAEDEKYRLRRDIERIRSRRAEVIARLRALLNSELAILEDHERQHPVTAADEVETELDEVVAESRQLQAEPAGSDVNAMEGLEESVEKPRHSHADPAPVQVSVEPAETDDTLRFETPPNAGQGDRGAAAPPSSAPPPTADRSGAERDAAADSSREDVRRDSPEMDKIRKILDDLA